MSRLHKFYTENINGIIITILFHILVLLILNVSQFKVKDEYFEAEIIIDFPIETKIEKKLDQKLLENKTASNQQQTNIASNKDLQNQTQRQTLSNEIDEEVEKAKQLSKEVSKQLKKEIPTIPDLKMPTKTTEGMNPDSIKKKLYTGDSNIEYSLENRYHLLLPIPVYLTQYAGVVKVIIQVNSNGTVTKAEPIVENNINDLMLSYAKTAALKTKFNQVASQNGIQTGYIKYRFVAQ